MSTLHPRLLFDAAELPAIRTRASTLMRPQLDALVAWAETRVDQEPPSELSGGYERRGDQVQDPFLANILAFSFLAIVADSPRYREAAKRWALALASMGTWTGELSPAGGTCGGCGYPEGWGLTALAVAYDWLHDHLEIGERAVIRAKIEAICNGLDRAAVGDDWWAGAYLHHDTWIPLGGLGLGAMAIIDESPNAGRWAERARDELDRALDWLDGDGAWPEGPCGWAFAMISAVPFWEAYRRRFPSRGAAILANPWLRRTASFRLYTRTPDGRFLGFGDCQPHGGYQQNAREAAPTLRWLAARYRDPIAQWLAAREWEIAPNAFTAAWEILFFDPAVPETPPDDLPVGARFANQEMVFARTAWREPNATTIAFRCDSLLGRRAASLYRPGAESRFNNSTTHVHADANSFAVWSRGQFAIPMARYGQNASEYQNTLLVDGSGQYTTFGPDHVGRPDGEITGFFTSRAGTAVAGDAARAYPPGLDRFVRRLFLIEPGVVFVVDDVAAEAPVDLEWRFHVDGDASLDVRDDGFTSVLEGMRTVLRFASPGGGRLGQTSDDWNRAVTVSSPGRARRGALAAALIPSVPEGAAARVEVAGERAFVVEAFGTTVLAAFGDGAEAIEVPGRLSAIASSAIAWSGSLLVTSATRVARDGVPILVASAPVNLSYARTPFGGELTVSAAFPTDIAIDTGLAVVAVRRPDGAPHPYVPSGTRISLRVPAGGSRFAILAA